MCQPKNFKGKKKQPPTTKAGKKILSRFTRDNTKQIVLLVQTLPARYPSTPLPWFR